VSLGLAHLKTADKYLLNGRREREKKGRVEVERREKERKQTVSEDYSTLHLFFRLRHTSLNKN
jgi:hypothetical protein